MTKTFPVDGVVKIKTVMTMRIVMTMGDDHRHGSATKTVQTSVYSRWRGKTILMGSARPDQATAGAPGASLSTPPDELHTQLHGWTTQGHVLWYLEKKNFSNLILSLSQENSG